MAWLLGLLLSVAPDLAGYPLPARDSDASVQFVLSNGRLTAGIDAEGRIAELRWPTVGYWDHLAYALEEGGRVSGGAHWALLARGGALQAPDTNRWSISHQQPEPGVLVTRYIDRSGAGRVTQRVYIPDAMDILVITLDLEDFSEPPRCLWYQHLAPSTSHVTGMADGYNRILQSGGFAAYYDPEAGMLSQFRPAMPAHEDWANARELAAGNAPPGSWRDFDEGVYWGVFSPTGVNGGVCASTRAPVAQLAQSLEATTRSARAGPSHGLVELAMEAVADDHTRASVALAVAATGTELQRLREAILQQGIPATLPPSPDVAPAEPSGDALADLLACVDEETGSIVRAPVANPALNHVAIFDTAWATAALDRWEYHTQSEQALVFHLETVRTTHGPAGLPGSLPAYVFTTKAPARFEDSANPAATAWLLAAVWRHYATQAPETGRDFLEAWAPVLMDAGDFLARAPDVGGVLAGVLKPEAASMALLQTHYLGLVSARGIVAALDRNEPGHWRSRREETYARMRFRQLDESRPDDRESPWLHYWVECLPEAARSSDGAWAILQAPEATPGDALLTTSASSAALPLHPAVPWALEASLELLAAPE